MRIKQLNEKNAQQYLELRLEALQKNPEAFASSYEEEKDDMSEKYINRFKTSEDTLNFGAFEGANLVGIVTLVMERKIKLRHRAYIVGMYVTEEKRGNGMGKALVLEAIEKARDIDGIEQLYLAVVTTNEAAKQLYISLGFEVFSIEKNALKYKNTYFDEYHMVLFL